MKNMDMLARSKAGLTILVAMTLAAATLAQRSVKVEIANLRKLATQSISIRKQPEILRALDDPRAPVRNEALKLLAESCLAYEGHFENTASLIRGEEYAPNLHLVNKISPQPSDSKATTLLAIRALCAISYRQDITRSINVDFYCDTGLEETLEYMVSNKLGNISRYHKDSFEKLVTDRDPNIVLAAYSHLGQKFADGQKKQITSFAKHRDPQFRMLACILLDRFHPESSVPILMSLLDDSHRNVKSTAASRLFRTQRQEMKLPMPPQAPSWAKRVLIEHARFTNEQFMLRQLETLFNDADPIVRLELLQASYAVMFRQDSQLARKMLADPSPKVQNAARMILVSRGEKE